MTPFEERISNLIQPSLEGLGYDLVRVQLNGQLRKTLQIMAERKDERMMTLDDCETISETLSAVLDVHDPIKERYALEVSSPGIDRPLVRARDYQRSVGFEANLTLAEAMDGRRHFKGHIANADDHAVTIQDEGKSFILPYNAILRGKLLLTDALIDAHLKLQQEAGNINTDPVDVDADIATETDQAESQQED